MPYPFRTILAPIQFDDLALVAVGVAKKIAKDFDATVHLHHVVPILPAFGQPSVTESAQTVAEERARESLRQIADRELAEVKHEIHTNAAAPSDTANAIIQKAKDLDADLIVLRTHGRHGLAHFIVGSVAEEVVRSAPCMVLTLTGPASDKALSA